MSIDDCLCGIHVAPDMTKDKVLPYNQVVLCQSPCNFQGGLFAGILKVHGGAHGNTACGTCTKMKGLLGSVVSGAAGTTPR